VLFIDKQRHLPKTIEVYKRLLHRLPKKDPINLVIENKIKAAEAGYTGECYVDNFLKKVDFPKHHALLKDLHIQINQNNFLQIDTLIVTKKFIAILEIKNIRGKTSFQKHPDQLIREVDGETTAFKCPKQQIKRHAKSLQILLQTLKIDIPIKSIIVLAYSKTHVVLPPKYTEIVMGCDISEHIDSYNQLPDVISTVKFHQLLNILVSKSTEFVPKPLAQIYPFDLSQIKTGLICPNCHVKINNHKNCPSCKTTKNLMQKQAIEDWFYLYKDTISNRECVYFLELKDKFAANYLLKKMDLHAINQHKSRHYVLHKANIMAETSK